MVALLPNNFFAPTIGIVVPAYNVAPYIAQTIAGIRAQTHNAFSCVIVDDGSRDDTFSVARAACNGDSRFTLLRQANAGASAARNAGFAALPQTEFVIFLDADDVWLPEALASLVAALGDDSAAVAAHGVAEWISPQGAPLHPGLFASYGRNRIGIQDGHVRTLRPTDPTTFDVLAVEMRIYPMSLILIRRAAIDAVGPLDPRFAVCHDVELFFRLATRGHFAFIDRVLCHYRLHANNLSANRARVDAELQLVRESILASPLLNKVHRELLKTGPRVLQEMKVSMWWQALRHEVRARHLARASQCAAHLAVNVSRAAALRLTAFPFSGSN